MIVIQQRQGKIALENGTKESVGMEVYEAIRRKTAL